ncbi:MAG TPA: MFS transporter, partial [Actinomycetota bacterium]|nr:MFS transporter [Actinomycetota bacterium]
MVEQARPVDEAALRSAVRRNTSALAVCLALSWAVVQLLSALGAVTLAALTGRRALAGVAPAVFLAGWAVAGLGMGRYMDARGRRPGLAAGFAVG